MVPRTTGKLAEAVVRAYNNVTVVSPKTYNKVTEWVKNCKAI